MIRTTINVGFITNSSSVVHFFDRRLLDDPDVKALIEAYGVKDGFVGSEMFNRGSCGSFLTNAETKAAAQEKMNEEYKDIFEDTSVDRPPYDVTGKDDQVVVIYGDEYDGMAQEICSALSAAARKLGLGDHSSYDFN